LPRLESKGATNNSALGKGSYIPQPVPQIKKAISGIGSIGTLGGIGNYSPYQAYYQQNSQGEQGSGFNRES